MSAGALIENAASGVLPSWSVAGPERREHMARVAALMDEWAARLGLPAPERVRWRAAGWLHDALRDADPGTLRALVPDPADLPDPLLHGPAAAARLAAEGVTDRELTEAVAYHTLGHPGLGRLGRALYLADFLEPGRTFEPVWRASLRARLPEALDAVLIEVAAARLGHLIRAGRAIRPETFAFWNSLVAGRR